MARIFLLRHAQPYFENGIRTVLGQRSDPPLSAEGLAQCKELCRCFAEKQGIAVYSSPMLRCRQTAQALGNAVKIIPDAAELDMGLWDGLSFDEIRLKWPEHYEKRGSDLSLPPPDGETLDAGADRLQKTLLALPDEDCIVVAHDGINRALICRLAGMPMSKNRSFSQPYGAINVIEKSDGKLNVTAVGKTAESLPDEAEIRALYKACGTPENVINHCEAVAETAMKLAEKIQDVNNYVNLKFLRISALLHDLCRTEGDHAQAAADVLESRGYIRLAAVIACHHDIDTERKIDEACLLYLADKLVQGTKRVSIEERFDASMAKCRDEEAKRANLRRRVQAMEIMRKYNDAVLAAGHKEENPI